MEARRAFLPLVLPAVTRQRGVKLVEQVGNLQGSVDALVVQGFVLSFRLGQGSLSRGQGLLVATAFGVCLLTSSLRDIADADGLALGLFLALQCAQSRLRCFRLRGEPGGDVLVAAVLAGVFGQGGARSLPAGVGVGQRVVDAVLLGSDGSQLLNAGLEAGLPLGLALDIALQLVAAVLHFRLQLRQHGVQRAVFVPVGMLVRAANRAGAIVLQRGTQFFDALAGGGFGQFQRALGLRGGGDKREIGLAGGGHFCFGVIAGSLQYCGAREQHLLARAALDPILPGGAFLGQ